MSQIFTRTCDILFCQYRSKAMKLSNNHFPPSQLYPTPTNSLKHEKVHLKISSPFQTFSIVQRMNCVTSDSTIFLALSLHGSERDDLDIFHGCRLQLSSMRVSTQLVRRWNATLMARPERHQWCVGCWRESGWWFEIFFIFTPTYLGKWSNLTIIFFKWVETTN